TWAVRSALLPARMKISKRAAHRLGNSTLGSQAICALFMLGGCESTDVPHGNERPPDGATITLVQENNYTANATFNIPSVDTPVSDLTFTWDAVTANVLCEPVIPSTDVGSAWVIRVEGRDQMGVRELIESFSLASAIDLIAGVPTSGRATTQAQLSEMTLSGATAPLGAQVSDFY